MHSSSLSGVTICSSIYYHVFGLGDGVILFCLGLSPWSTSGQVHRGATIHLACYMIKPRQERYRIFASRILGSKMINCHMWGIVAHIYSCYYGFTYLDRVQIQIVYYAVKNINN